MGQGYRDRPIEHISKKIENKAIVELQQELSKQFGDYVVGFKVNANLVKLNVIYTV